MRILLTGVSGQIGSALRSPLASLGSVLAADRTLLDFTRPNEMPGILDALAPDLIVNTAAYTAVDQAEDEQELAYCVNAEAPRAMARWAAAHDVPVVHFSTDYVFDGTGDRPWREDDPTVPLSVYGASKLAGETAVRDAGGSHLVIRTSWIYASQGTNFFTTIARLAREPRVLQVVADQVGAPTSARSVAQGVVSVLGSDFDTNGRGLRKKFEQANGLLHLCSSGETTRHDFACAIVDGLRSKGSQPAASIEPVETKKFFSKAARPLNSRLAMDRLDKIFGIRMSAWQDGFDRELGNFVQRVEGGRRSSY